MKVRFWGVRGSIPSPGPHTMRYGGNTTCIEVRSDDDSPDHPRCRHRNISAGAATAEAVAGAGQHLHDAHALGPHPGPALLHAALHSRQPVRIHGGYDVVSGAASTRSWKCSCSTASFPVREAEMRPRSNTSTLNVGEPVVVGDATVTPLMLNHPVVNFGYRVDCNGKSVFFTGDHEPWPNIYAPDDEGYAEYQQIVDQQQAAARRGGGRPRPADRRQFLHPAEYPAKVGWGHGTLEGQHRLGAPAWCQETGVHPPRADAFRR
jgi:hypothetical protein